MDTYSEQTPSRPRGTPEYDRATVDQVVALLVARREDGRAEHSYRSIQRQTGVPFGTVRNWNNLLRQGKYPPSR